MGKFLLIGGGECGRPGTAYETEEFDREIIRLTGKKNPNYLLIAMGSLIPELYYDVMKKVYDDMWKCNTDRLTLDDLKDYEILKKKIEWADIIYVGGGNTLKMMKIFRKYKIDVLLEKAYHDDKVLCGVSAGAICWCNYGNSDSRKISDENANIIRVKGLGFLNMLFCPHYDKEEFRQPALKEMMKTTYKMPAMALYNGAALEIVGDKCKLITCFENAKGFKCFWQKGEYIIEELDKKVSYSLEELCSKNF